MGLPAIANRPLPINHYLNEVPEKNAFRLRCKAFALNVLEKICWVAFIAITAVIFTVSYTGIAITGSLPLIMVGLALSTPFLGIGASQFHHWSKGYARQAQIEQGVADQLKEISEWKTPEIQQFFREQHLILDRLPMEALALKCPQDPLCALLPLIARFKFMNKLGLEIEESSQKKLNHEIERTIAEAEAERGQPIEENKKRNIRLTNRQIAWNQHEHEAIPRALEAAVVLHLIEQPILELSLTDIGEFRAKTYEERMFDRHFLPINDDYFAFHSALQRPPLTLAEIEQDMSPSALRFKLFPLAIRV